MSITSRTQGLSDDRGGATGRVDPRLVGCAEPTDSMSRRFGIALIRGPGPARPWWFARSRPTPCRDDSGSLSFGAGGGPTPMDPEGSVTRWISLLKEGDHAAASPLWEKYFHRLVALARNRLRGTPRRA